MSLKRNHQRYSRQPPQNLQELLLSIERDRGVLEAYLQKLNSQQEDSTTSAASEPLTLCALSAPQAPPALPAPPVPPVQQRCSYDLFFESACLTVKSLPPKLAAEAKSRISQIITEFEIRAIEMKALQQEQQTKDKCSSTSADQQVYKFHPCP